MLTHLELCFKHKNRIDHASPVLFKAGYNAVIGPNGSGKSTLLEAMTQCKECKRRGGKKTQYHYFNSETMNPHRDDKAFRGVKGSMIKIRAMFSSHGETMRDVLRFIPLKPGDCFILDEPEAGHDLEWIIKIREGLDMLTQKGCQVIVASHHPVFWRDANLIELKKNYLNKARDEMNAQVSYLYGCNKKTRV